MVDRIRETSYNPDLFTVSFNGGGYVFYKDWELTWDEKTKSWKSSHFKEKAEVTDNLIRLADDNSVHFELRVNSKDSSLGYFFHTAKMGTNSQYVVVCRFQRNKQK